MIVLSRVALVIRLRMSGVDVVKYDYDGDIVLWNKDTNELLDMDDGSYIAMMKCDPEGV